ncbi:MAG: sigma-70 family RNA polymerase sigma factor [Lachnospiraceae bacterium]|nr:sigma-70 family RNA polymerase sigma factor [Lachnospiraceae bacterium]
MTTFLKPLKGSEERKYLEEWAAGDREAREKLILHNMRLVAHVVKKYAQSEADAEDLISIGTIGLIKAVDTFDVKRASRLGTYAAKCIDNAILFCVSRGAGESVRKILGFLFQCMVGKMLNLCYTDR